MSRSRRRRIPRSRAGLAAIRPNRLARSIVKALGRYGSMPTPLKTIVSDTKSAERSIKRELSALIGAGLVEKPFHGHYRLKDQSLRLAADPNGVTGIHDLLCVGTNWPDAPTTGSAGPRFPVGRWDWSRATFDAESKQYELRLMWGTRWVRFTWSPSTSVVTLNVPAERRPIEFEEMSELMGWIQALTDPLDGGKKFELRKVGINRDLWLWELDGLRSIRLRAWTNAFRQIYQKYDRMVRDEVHLTLKELALRDGLEAIMGMSPTALLAKSVAGEAALREAEEKLAKALQAPPAAPPVDGTGYG